MLKHVLTAALAAALLSLPVQSSNAQAPAPDAAAKPAKPRAATAPGGGRAAMLERQKKCGVEWREAKAGGKVEKGMTWPKFWSACYKRLKGA